MPGAPGTSRPTPPRKRLRRLARRLLVTSILLPLLAFAAFELAVRLLPYPANLDRPPPAATLLLDRDGRPLAAFAASDGRWHLPLSQEQVSPHLLDAIVAVEDGRFRDHAGVDWAGVGGAARDTLLGRRRGASTITMQLQRLRDPRPRGWLAKLDQAVRARQIERSATKDAILAEYVNRAPFGGALVGAGAASWRYFGKPCRDLSLGEAALLAGLPQNPNAFRPDRHPDAALRRRSHVLARMRALGQITAAQQADADAEPLTATWRPLPQERPTLVQAEARTTTPTADGALAALLAANGRRSTGFQPASPTAAEGGHRLEACATGGTIVTAIDARTQRLAADVAGEQLRSLAASGVSAAAVVVLDTRTAEVLATVSLELADGRLAASRIDLAQRARSTGSVLKPFIYAAAFDAGSITPQTVLRDEPAAWAAYVPANYDRAFAGDMPAAEALARSRNVPALAVLERVGVGRAVGVMEGLGVATPAHAARPVGLSLAVGGAEATVTEVAQAFAALARGGVPRPASLNRRADAIDPAAVGCLRPVACWQTLHALSDPARTAVVCPEAARAGVAWKTGTSSGHRDAWCAAATPNVTVVAWFGDAGGRASPVLSGQEAAAPAALRLVAALDPTPPAWPEVEAEPVVAAERSQFVRPASVEPSDRRLVITSPAEDARVVLDPDLPADRQRVALGAAWSARATAGPAGRGDDTVHWFVDGTLVGTARVGERLWWDPKPGAHEVRATDARGRSATVRFRVAAAGR